MKKRTPRAGITVAVMIAATLLSKLLGMIRQMILASVLADSMEGVAFAAASKIPLSIFDMLFSAAVLGAFIPVYSGARIADDGRARRFSASFFTAITVITALLAVTGVLLARPIIAIAAPNLNLQTAALAASLLRIMFPAMIFAGAAYTLIGILQVHEKFILPALVSSFSNIVIILYLLLFYPKIGGIYGLAFAYLVSWMVQFLTLVVPLIRIGRMPRLTLRLSEPDLKLSVRRSLPVMVGSWLIPAGTLIATFFSSYADSNGVAIVSFDYAFSVYSILAGILTYGVCNFIFPKLSEKMARGDGEGFSSSVRGASFSSLAMVFPVATAAFLLAEEGVRLLYLRGNFTEALAVSVSESLQLLAVAMPAYCLVELLSRVFYASGRMRLPMAATLAGLAVGSLFCALFQLSGSLSIRTIALGNAAGQIAAALILLFACLRTFPGILRHGDLSKLLLWGVSVAFSAAVMFFLRQLLRKMMQKSGEFENFLLIGIVFTGGIVVYLICMILTKVLPLPIKPKGGGSLERQ